MTHNPHANKYPVGGRPWTDEDDRTALAMKDAGLALKDIAECLSRSIPAVKCRAHYLKLTPEQRRKEKQSEPPPAAEIYNFAIKTIVPDSVIEDRNRRLMASRDLTARLMGDPAPQYSALAQRGRA